MSKAGIVILVGLLIAALPFLGIPAVAKTVIAVLLGIVIIGLGFLMREERRYLLRALSGEHTTDAYTENGAKGYGERYAAAREEA